MIETKNKSFVFEKTRECSYIVLKM